VQVLLQDQSDDVVEFSSGSWGSKMGMYYKNLANINESRWKELLDACGGGGSMEDDAGEEYRANLSFLDHNHAILFDFSSPVKP
jgi:hypothetical protein